MPQPPHSAAALTVTCPLCGHAQALDTNQLQDLQVTANEVGALALITARLSCAGCGRGFLITLQAKPEAQAAPI